MICLYLVQFCLQRMFHGPIPYTEPYLLWKKCCVKLIDIEGGNFGDSQKLGSKKANLTNSAWNIIIARYFAIRTSLICHGITSQWTNPARRIGFSTYITMIIIVRMCFKDGKRFWTD